ncbi:MAG: hypothetical protein NTU73_01370, partial [Ignavibacteriae bacterium]|nr:hypothetical protein [Ignavibacteriota bacterium]
MKKFIFLLVLLFLFRSGFSQKSKILTYSGKIDEKYEIQMVLSLKDDNKVVGYYYYEKYNIKIPLEGIINNNVYKIKEYPDFEIGFKKGFELESYKKELNGFWVDSMSNKTLNVQLKRTNNPDVKFIKKYIKVEGFYIDEINSRTLFRDIQLYYIADNIFLFGISSVHENGCNGFFKELIEFDKDLIGIYSTNDCAELKMIYNTDELTIEEKDCSAYHGMRCPFNGKYK